MVDNVRCLLLGLRGDSEMSVARIVGCNDGDHAMAKVHRGRHAVTTAFITPLPLERSG